MQLRNYQQECVDIISGLNKGSYLVQMATGLGKTVTFANIPRNGRMLIISHREELVRQPLKYFDCETSVEMSKHHSNKNSEVVSASVQSLYRRLNNFSPDEFEIIITDECHHAASKSYKRIYDYFSPRLHLGFTATPNRSDNMRLDDVFEDIIFERDLRWGIENKYLSDIYCRRAHIGYDLSNVRTRCGDYAPGELDEAMSGTAEAIAEAYTKMAKGATLIFAVSVKQANEIADKIPGAVAITGNTKNRAEIIERFTKREIPCIVNCMVFTEGTDIPLVETIIIARPTQSDSLYAQMVGRGLRLSPGKDKLNLIDCVGVSGKSSLCTAPSLLGIDTSQIPESRQSELTGLLFEIPERAEYAADCPESWIRNIEIVDLWAKKQNYNTHNVNYFRMPDGKLICSLPNNQRIKIPAQDEIGRVKIRGEVVPMQKALDRAYQKLCADFDDCRAIWDLSAVKKWGNAPASEKQLKLINRVYKNLNIKKLNKLQASQILNRKFSGRAS